MIRNPVVWGKHQGQPSTHTVDCQAKRKHNQWETSWWKKDAEKCSRGDISEDYIKLDMSEIKDQLVRLCVLWNIQQSKWQGRRWMEIATIVNVMDSLAAHSPWTPCLFTLKSCFSVSDSVCETVLRVTTLVVGRVKLLVSGVLRLQIFGLHTI